MPFEKSEPVNTGRIVPSSYYYALVTLFWLWGAFGFLVNVGLYIDAAGKSVGVGTSAHMPATMLLWIGGMILFGLGALIGDKSTESVGANLNGGPVGVQKSRFACGQAHGPHPRVSIKHE